MRSLLSLNNQRGILILFAIIAAICIAATVIALPAQKPHVASPLSSFLWLLSGPLSLYLIFVVAYGATKKRWVIVLAAIALMVICLGCLYRLDAAMACPECNVKN